MSEADPRSRIRNSAIVPLALLSVALNPPSDALSASQPPAPVEHTEQAKRQSKTQTAQELGKIARKANTSPARLRDVRELPGFNLKTTGAQRKNLAQSVVQVLRRKRGDKQTPAGDWEKNCTANVIHDSRGEMIVSFASHCDTTATGRLGMIIDNSVYPSMDTSEISSFDFAIAEPKLIKRGSTLEGAIIGKVNAVSTNMRGVDLTLAKATKIRRIRKKPLKINFRTMPKLGEQVALSSLPAVADNTQINTSGRYLGMIKRKVEGGGGYSRFAAVGVTSKTSKKDACNLGASGASALTASTRTLSALSGRINGGYPSGELQAEDTYEYWDKDGNRQTGTHKALKAELARELGVDLGIFPTICLFAAPNQGAYTRMLRGFRTEQKISKSSQPPRQDVVTYPDFDITDSTRQLVGQ